MRKIIASSLLLVSCLLSLNCYAQNTDPLWEKVVSELRASEKYVAQDIEQKIAFRNDDSVKQGLFKLKLSEWKKGLPIYSVLSLESPSTEQKPKKPIDIEEIFVSLRKTMLSKAPGLSRKDDVDFNGVPATLFEVGDSGIQKANMRIWVHSQSGQIYQYRLSVYVPFAFDAETRVSFADTPVGTRLGTQRHTELKFLIPFKKGQGSIVETLSNWAPSMN